jgi:GMP synthase-like glutamine amidotransferase
MSEQSSRHLDEADVIESELTWRKSPGLLGQHPSSIQSIHALLGYYLRDRNSPTPFRGQDRLVQNDRFEWGVAPPLEKVINSQEQLERLLGLPELSKNIAYVLQQVADADSILYPLWQSGITNPDRVANVLSAGIATVVQGGNPSVYDAASFSGYDVSVAKILSLTDRLLLRRSAGSAPSIFICLGHQLAAESHVRLIRKAVRDIDLITHLPLDPENLALRSLQNVARKIRETGKNLEVIKQGETIARGWLDSRFCVAENEKMEIGTRQLLPYRRSPQSNHIPTELHDVHALIADEHEGVIDTMISLERELHIEMFHSDEVNEEAALFANWAYKLLHDTIIPIRYEIAISPLSWLLQLPYAVEILSQTAVDEETMTEVSTTAIYYKDWETHTIRRSFSCQFHPELMADIRDIGKRDGPRYAELKDNDGIRLLIRLLYHGMQE